MRAVILSLFLTAATAALADSEARQGADSVRVTANPCSDEKVLAVLAALGENPLDYRAARAQFQGSSFNGCWKPMYENGVIFLRYEDGDAGVVPMSELKPVKEA